MFDRNDCWIADNGDGTYRNPILYTDYSDPDAIRVGDDYFMTASSFSNAPGLPILHSKDLVNWTVINYAITQIPDPAYDQAIPGCGVWAPAIRFYDGLFYIVFPMPDEGIYVTTAKDPWGKWSTPHSVFQGKGWIDPCPFWDEDGRCYIVSAYAKSRIGFNNILHLMEVTPDCSRILDIGKDIFDANQTLMTTLEGPKLYKRNGWYYIFAPSGGVKQGCQTILRSKQIWGPYEYRDVLMQKDTPVNGPHQGAWVTTQTGEDWFLHFQDVYAAGRIVHLQPMHWTHDDWPVIGDALEEETCGKPVLRHKKPDIGRSYAPIYPEASDDFDKQTLGLQWQWNANWKSEWYTLHPRNNELILYAVNQPSETSISLLPNLLLQKWNLPQFTCTTKLNLTNMNPGDSSGFLSLAEQYAGLEIQASEKGKKLVLFFGKQSYEGQHCTALDEKKELVLLEQEEVYLQLRVHSVPPVEWNRDGAFAFPIPREHAELSYSLDGKNYEKVYEFVPVPGRWVGQKMGLFSTHTGHGSCGKTAVSFFHIEALKE